MTTPDSFTEPTSQTGKPSLEWSARADTLRLVDALLKTPEAIYQRVAEHQLGRNQLGLLLITVACLLIYGLIMGSFSGGVQWLAAPLKILVGTLLAALLCFPSLYIFSALSGADLQPSQLLGLLLGGLALNAILLLGFVPVAFIFTFSIRALPFMGAVHLLIWGCSLFFALRYLANGLRYLGGQNPLMIKAWAVILVLTLCQMSTTLRPVLGEADSLFTAEKRFFLVHWIELLR